MTRHERSQPDVARTRRVRGERLITASIHLRESDVWHHVPVYTEIVRRARKAGLAGATVLRGIAGFGKSGNIHRTSVLRLAGGLPVVVVLVEQEPQLNTFLGQLGELDISGLIVLEEVHARSLPRSSVHG
jgi:PII-like signaling protein